MRIISIILIVFVCGGCAVSQLNQLPTPQNNQPIRTGNIASNPPGADVYYFNGVYGKKLLGKTPCTITYQSPDESYAGEGYLFLTLSGYETAYLQFQREGEISHNFELEKDIAIQIKESNPPQNKEYLKRVIDVVGKCDKVLRSPKMLAASVASEASSDYQELEIDFPQYKEIILNRFLSTLVTLTVNIANAEDYAQEPMAIVQMQNLISKIKHGVGVE